MFFEVSISRINAIMTEDIDWKARGMGESVETYIVGHDFLMRTDSRFLVDDRGKYLEALRKRGVPEDTIALIQSTGTSILYQRVETAATKAALAGATGIRIIDDYRGVPVLSSFSPLGVDGLDWVIISEVDTREAFASIVHLQENLIFTALIMLLVGAVAGYLLSTTIARPLKRLSDTSEQFGNGDLHARADLTSKDELGDLAATFNSMADKLQIMTTELKQEVRVRQAAEEELKDSHEQLRQLSAYLQSGREEERKHLAREIHDELGQALTAIKMDAALLERRYAVGDDEFRKRTRDMLDVINDTIKAVKRITTELRPGILDDLGLSAALEWQTEEFNRRTGIECELSCSQDLVHIEPSISTAVFRIFQETLTNVARHAEATHVNASLIVENGTLLFELTDNGRGISDAGVFGQTGFGILGMRERASTLGGTFHITASAGSGTTVRVSIPLNREVEA
jgi:signal transduction histidine kinase